jgi:hypothetical protein
MIGYKKTSTSKQEWLTPPEIIKSLGEFDLDPCAPIVRPWDTAKHHFTINDNGLLQSWFGRIWLNPPYDDLEPWMNRIAMHSNGIVLIPGRTDIEPYHNFVFPVADSILFIKQRLHFYHVDGTRADHNSGGPSVLISYGEFNSDCLAQSNIDGAHVLLNRIAVVVAGVDRSWRVVVKTVMCKLNEASLDVVYQEVEAIAGDKVAKNKHYKEKIRQMLQRHFRRVKKGHYAN